MKMRAGDGRAWGGGPIFPRRLRQQKRCGAGGSATEDGFIAWSVDRDAWMKVGNGANLSAHA